MALTDAQLTELWDKQALHDNLMQYARGADRFDKELMRSTYWEDSWDDHGNFQGPGHEWPEAGMREPLEPGSHHVSNVYSEIEGNRAKRESMFICTVPFKDPPVTAFIGGRYRDLCEKRDGVWKVLYRTCIWDWTDVRPLNADFGMTGMPRVSNWGAYFPEDPIYKDWGSSDPTEYGRVQPAHFSD